MQNPPELSPDQRLIVQVTIIPEVGSSMSTPAVAGLVAIMMEIGEDRNMEFMGEMAESKDLKRLGVILLVDQNSEKGGV